MDSARPYQKFSIIYLSFFFGFGAVMPLVALFLESVGLSGVQIGTITATGAFISVFSGPMWGYISDRFHLHKQVVITVMSITIVTALIITRLTSYIPLFIAFLFYFLTMSPINSLMDGIVIQTNLAFGSIRLWGSIGFALAAYFSGAVADRTSMSVIFIILAASLFISVLFIQRTTIEIEHSEPVSFNVLLQLLRDKKFIVFMTYTSLISCTLAGHNIFYGLYYRSLGGSTTMVGLAFLLFALGEAPIMQLAARYLRTNKPYWLLAFAPIIGVLRWGFYSVNPPTSLLLWTFLLQGLFYAPFLVGVAEYIRLELPSNLQTTAMTLFVAMGFGLGSIFSNYLSGWLYENTTANMIYVSYAVFCLLSLLFVPYLMKHRTVTE